MSPLFSRGTGADHDRARELAAARLDEMLPAGDGAWLEDHLDACPDCSFVAAEYDEQRSFFGSMRRDSLEPPRDLWARTAAALESEGARGFRRPWRHTRVLPLAPVAGLMVIAIAVGAGLFNGRSLFPGSTGNPGGPIPTPINVAATDVSVVSRGDDGTVQILTRRVDQVCPVGADACGISPTIDVTTTASIGGTADLDAILSPAGDRVVVVERGPGATGVYVLNVGAAAPAPTPSAAPAVTPAPTGDPGNSAPPTQDPGLATASPTSSPDAPTPDPSASTTPGPGTTGVPVTPDPSATATPAPEPTATPAEPTATPDADPTATPAVTPESTAPAPTPTVAVSPRPDGALEIARGVIVVGSTAAYAPDGSMFAFTARPADGSAGPDVYVWTVGDAGARAVTSDHAAVFSGWLGGRLVVSRVVDGKPETVVMNPASGTETAVGGGPTWRPAVGPGRHAAVWWDGTVKLADDGVTPVPGAGHLVLGAWPAGSESGKVQVLHRGSLVDWDTQWDEEGTVLAVWTTAKDSGTAGSLSLYAIDAATGRADLDHPLLDGAPAFAGFSLESGRLVWSAPADGGNTTVQMLAWSGAAPGRVELPTEQGATVVH